MKKLLTIAAALVAFTAICANAQMMDDKDLAVTVISTATNSATLTLRGELFGAYIDVPTAASGTVTIATDQQTLFTKASIAADVWYPLQYPQYGSTGSALTFVGGTNNTANAHYARAPLAGLVTVTVIGESAGTNTYNVKLIYKK